MKYRKTMKMIIAAAALALSACGTEDEAPEVRPIIQPEREPQEWFTIEGDGSITFGQYSDDEQGILWIECADDWYRPKAKVQAVSGTFLGPYDYLFKVDNGSLESGTVNLNSESGAIVDIPHDSFDSIVEGDRMFFAMTGYRQDLYYTFDTSQLKELINVEVCQ